MTCLEKQRESLKLRTRPVTEADSVSYSGKRKLKINQSNLRRNYRQDSQIELLYSDLFRNIIFSLMQENHICNV